MDLFIICICLCHAVMPVLVLAVLWSPVGKGLAFLAFLYLMFSRVFVTFHSVSLVSFGT